MSERIYRWAQISHWDFGDAARAGQLRALCAGPGCPRILAVTSGAFPPRAPLWILAQRMRCRSCGHLGAQFEVWGAVAVAKFAERHAPAWQDDRRPKGRR